MRIAPFQDRMERLVEEIKSLSLPRLGPTYAGLHGTELHDALVAHRIVKTFQRPVEADAAKRRSASIASFFERNASVKEFHTLFDVPSGFRRHFIEAQQWLASTLKGVRPTYRAVFPSGETVLTAHGNTDLYHKLSSGEQWNVSVDALDYAAKIAYHNLWLKRVVKARFKHIWGSEPAKRRQAQWFSDCPKGRHAGFYVFKRMFASCCDIIGFARVTTVPKSNEDDRVISCEPLWNMVCQLSYAHDLRDALRRRHGINLATLQEVHRALLRSGPATVDFSAASDTNAWATVRLLWPPHVVKILGALRSQLFHDGETYTVVKMFGPMGGGLTFDVMTLTLLAYARVLDKSSSVFGDDVIISQQNASRFIECCEAYGWRINGTKSFTHGNFRESCGGFADLKMQKLLLCYEFWWPVTSADCHVLLNKLGMLLRSMNKSRLRDILMRGWLDGLNFVACDAFSQQCVGLSEDFVYFPLDISPLRTTTLAIQVWSQMWQRSIELTSVERLIRKDVRTSTRMQRMCETASFFYRGMSYDIPVGKDKVKTTRIDRFSGVSLSQVTLVSVII